MSNTESLARRGLAGVSQTVISEETDHLRSCLLRIDELVSQGLALLGRPRESAPVQGQAVPAVALMKGKQIEELRLARASPYFGRVDFVEDSDPSHTRVYYFGRHRIPLDYVFNWRAPIGRLFYQPLEGRYDAPGGRITGEVKLKREVVVERGALIGIADYELLPTATKQRLAPGDATLTARLAQAKGVEMQDIVATIQPRQYEQIIAALQQVMIIQGVAGSGKSEVGLHRVAYLLSPYNELKLRIVPEKVVVFGPSRAFLKYIANLLPGLEVPRVKQTTIRDWLVSISSSRIRLERGDRLLERQLLSRADMDGELRVAKTKNSLQMARILERYVGLLRQRFGASAKPLMIGGKTVVPASRIRGFMKGSSGRPLNRQRQEVLASIQGYMRKRLLINASQGQGLPVSVISQFDSFWPVVDFRAAYVELLSDPAMLTVASKGAIGEQDGNLFRPPSGMKTFGRADLAALCYLDQLVNGVGELPGDRASAAFDHVVVDEAQDAAPLELLLIYHRSSNKSFTILGDMGQFLLEHRGTGDWKEVRQIFAKESVRRWDARINYRGTVELTRYTNRILKKIAPKQAKAIPYARHGERPRFVRSKTHAEMVSAVASDIRSLRQGSSRSIAVLCKTMKEATALKDRLIREGVNDAVLLDAHQAGRSEVVIAPIYQTRGIEFDVVILVNARKQNYPDSRICGRLLYVAATRAAHILHIHWYGALPDILVESSSTARVGSGGSRRKRRTSRSGGAKRVDQLDIVP